MAWVTAGGDCEQFWRLTPWLARRVSEGMVARAEEDYRGLMTSAWSTAVLGRTKRVPTLREFLGDAAKDTGESVANRLRTALRSMAKK